MRIQAYFTLAALISAAVLMGWPKASLQGRSPIISPEPSFEVVSIKPSPSASNVPLWRFLPLNSPHCEAASQTARSHIEAAYGIKDFQLAGVPPWASSKRYDVKVDIDQFVFEHLRSATFAEQWNQIQLMLQSALAERFRLRVARSSKQLPVMALIATNGATRHFRLAVPPFSGNLAGTISTQQGRDGARELHGAKATMDNLANVLSRILNQQVVNKTRITGNYNFTISWADPTPVDTDASEPGLSLQAALKEQVGLKLKSEKAPVELITIEHIEEPTPD